MPFIAFLGCDGSGKSTVISAVTRQLKESGIPVHTGHWRPKPFAGGNPSAPSSADDPHGQSPRGTLGSLIKLGWLWTNWWTAWLLHLGRESRHGMLVFDRYHGDLLVDPRRYRYGGPMWLARMASRCMPQPDHVFFLDAPPEVLLSRKREVDEAALIKSRNAYLEFCQGSNGFHIIDARPSVETVTRQVMDCLGR